MYDQFPCARCHVFNRMFMVCMCPLVKRNVRTCDTRPVESFVCGLTNLLVKSMPRSFPLGSSSVPFVLISYCGIVGGRLKGN